MYRAADKFFGPTGIIRKSAVGEAEHALARSFDFLNPDRQLAINSIVDGDLNQFKKNLFDIPVKNYFNEYNNPNTTKARRVELKNLIEERKKVMNALTGGQKSGIVAGDIVNFRYGANEITATSSVKPIDTLFKEGKFNIDDYIERGNKYTEAFQAVTKDIDIKKDFSKPINKNQLDDLLLKLSGQIDRDCAGAIKQASKDGGRIGLKTIGSRDVCITKARNYMSQELINGIGTQQNAKTSLIKRILAGSANFLKQNLSPKELLKMENLIGKPALYGAAAFETGLVADDVLRKGKPLNVAAAESLFGTVLNLDADAAKAKNLLESNAQLSPAAQEYAQNIIDYDRYRKNELSFPSSLVAKSMPGSDKYFKMQEDLKNKIMTTPDTGALDYQSSLTESEAIFKAKPKDLFGFEIDSPDAPEVTPLTNKFAQPPGRRVGPMTAKQDMKIDLTPITYKNFEPNIPSKEELEKGLRNIGMIGQDEIITDEAYQQKFYKPEEFSQLFQVPSFTGANQRFEKGGRAGFKRGTPKSMLRKGILELIDDTVKSTPKDTTSTLDKLIKRTLDEDFLDKKDTIIDTLNAKIARERKNFPYNQQVFEEPSQLDFYDAITKSNFRTKTGPFFDYQKRKNKAGGGLLKQAGDRSGPPPESGPNPQGLQGLLNRVKRV